MAMGARTVWRATIPNRRFLWLFVKSAGKTAAEVNNSVQLVIGTVTLAVTGAAWWKFGFAWGVVALLFMVCLIAVVTGGRLQKQLSDLQEVTPLEGQPRRITVDMPEGQATIANWNQRGETNFIHMPKGTLSAENIDIDTTERIEGWHVVSLSSLVTKLEPLIGTAESLSAEIHEFLTERELGKLSIDVRDYEANHRYDRETNALFTAKFQDKVATFSEQLSGILVDADFSRMARWNVLGTHVIHDMAQRLGVLAGLLRQLRDAPTP